MSGIYNRARYDLLAAQMNWLTISLKLTAWSGTPDFDPTDTSIAAIKARGAVERGVSLPINATAVTIDGTAQTDSVLIPTVAIGPDVTWFTMSRKDAVVPDNSVPILFIDDADGLPFVANGLDMLIQPDWLAERGWWRP